MNYKYFGFIVLPIFLLGIAGISAMVYTSAYVWLILTVVFWILLSGLGIAAGFHRIYSHRCYIPKPWLDNLLLMCGTLACQSSSVTWVATHIGYHHPYSDTDRDPHTPKKGIWHSFMGWTLKVNAATVNHKYAVKLLRKKNHVFVHKHYFSIVWGFSLLLAIINWKVFLFGYCIAAMISILQDNLVNVLGHSPKLGYRNYRTHDISSNFPLLGYFGWGQGWHNNHHKFPNRFDFGIKWWEFDPCVIFIPLLKIGSDK
jgi:sn-1 stearoyl-lipid 9-desaturase